MMCYLKCLELGLVSNADGVGLGCVCVGVLIRRVRLLTVCF